MKSLRIVFMGTPEFAVPSLTIIARSSHSIVGVVTQPDRPRGRGQKRQPPPIKMAALELGLSPILQPERLGDPQFIAQLTQLNADLFVVVAFRILPESVFTIPPLGTINLHPSLLPRYRGAAPIHWAVIQGETTTGVTTIFIRKEVDAGNIILQKSVPIREGETAGELHDRLATIGAELLLETINRIATGTVPSPKPQDPRLVTHAPKLTREIAQLNFQQPAHRVQQWILGLSPYPGAYTYWRDKQLKIYRARALDEAVTADPGTIVQLLEDGLVVACQPGKIVFTEVQLEGKKRMSAGAFIRGYRPRVGEKLGEKTIVS